MPELPEVETIVRDLRPLVVGRRIGRATLSHDDVLRGVTRRRLLRLGYPVSDMVTRDYGQTEFFLTDDDGYSHCFGVPTRA